MSECAFPDDFVLKIVFAENLVEHHFDVVRGVPVAVVVKTSGLFQDASQLDAPRPHEFDIGLRGSVTILERSFLPRLTPENFVVAVRIERRIDVDQVDRRVWQFFQLIEIVTAVDDAGVEERRTFSARRWHVGKS